MRKLLIKLLTFLLSLTIFYQAVGQEGKTERIGTGAFDLNSYHIEVNPIIKFGAGYTNFKSITDKNLAMYIQSAGSNIEINNLVKGTLLSHIKAFQSGKDIFTKNAINLRSHKIFKIGLGARVAATPWIIKDMTVDQTLETGKEKINHGVNAHYNEVHKLVTQQVQKLTPIKIRQKVTKGFKTANPLIPVAPGVFKAFNALPEEAQKKLITMKTTEELSKPETQKAMKERAKKETKDYLAKMKAIMYEDFKKKVKSRAKKLRVSLSIQELWFFVISPTYVSRFNKYSYSRMYSIKIGKFLQHGNQVDQHGLSEMEKVTGQNSRATKTFGRGPGVEFGYYGKLQNGKKEIINFEVRATFFQYRGAYVDTNDYMVTMMSLPDEDFKKKTDIRPPTSQMVSASIDFYRTIKLWTAYANLDFNRGYVVQGGVEISFFEKSLKLIANATYKEYKQYGKTGIQERNFLTEFLIVYYLKQKAIPAIFRDRANIYFTANYCKKQEGNAGLLSTPVSFEHASQQEKILEGFVVIGVGANFEVIKGWFNVGIHYRHQLGSNDHAGFVSGTLKLPNGKASLGNR